MPIREHICINAECPFVGFIEEKFFHPREDVEPECGHCRVKMERLASSFGVSGAGELSGGGGHWAVCKKDLDGAPLAKPEHVYIDTPSKQNSYVKREGLVHPANLTSNSEKSADQIRSHVSTLELDRKKVARQQLTEARRQFLAKRNP